MRLRKNKGFALALALFIIVILATVCFGALNITTLDSRTAVEDYKSSRAFYAARAGIAFAKSELTDSARVSTTTQISYGKTYLQLANGQQAEEAFSLVITPASDNLMRVFRIWKVESTGYYDNASRRIVAFLEQESFAKYGYFTDVESTSSMTIRFANQDKLTGTVHTNGYFTMSGHPSFGGEVTSANLDDINYNADTGTYRRTDGRTVTDNKEFYRAANNNYTTDGPQALNDSADFTFSGGQKKIDLPTSTASDIIQVSKNNGTYLDGNYKIVFTADGKAKCYPISVTTTTKTIYDRYGRPKTTTVTKNSYQGYPTKAGEPDNPAYTLDTTRSPGAIIYVNGQSEISGDIKGRVTFASSENTYIVDDLQYVDDNKCVLGILSQKNIIVRTDKNTRQDFYLDAIMMALTGSFTVENYDSGICRGTLNLFGGVIQRKRGAVGTSSNSSLTTSTGYIKNYVYDPKLETMPPLNFPNTGKFTLRYVIDKGSLGGV